MVQPLQAVESKGEMLALELANMLEAGEQKAASKKLSDYADEHKLAYWEAVAIAGIAARMQHGQKWKK